MAERRTPTPVIKGNLPPRNDPDWSEGHEVPAKRMEWYEKGIATPQGTTTYRPSFGPYPEPSGKGMTQADIDEFDRTHQFNKGGRVSKHGSDTCIVSKCKFS